MSAENAAESLPVYVLPSCVASSTSVVGVAVALFCSAGPSPRYWSDSDG